MSKILLHLKMLKRGVGDEVYKLQFKVQHATTGRGRVLDAL